MHLKLKPETSEDRRPSTSKATSKASGCKLTIGDSWSTCSPKAKPHSAGLQKKRTLKLSLSTASEESRCTRHYDENMLALEDIKDEDKVEADQDDDEEQQENIEDTNGEPFVYQWDDVTNKGKRQKPGGRWHLCHWQEENRTTGFMTCC